MTYPLHLDLTGRRVLVVGAGHVAERRITALLDEGADVVVVAPAATPAATFIGKRLRMIACAAASPTRFGNR